MKKYLLSFFLIVAFAFYIVLNNQGTTVIGSPTGAPAASNVGSQNSTETSAPAGGAPASNGAGTQTPTPAPAAAPSPAGGQAASGGQTAASGQAAYKDGTYTGSVADAFYGNVQVAAVIKNGQLADVQVLQYPSDRGTSRAINGAAMPQLVQEALQAQSANVNIVSGATQSSGAFQQSLAAALTQAKT